MVLLDLTSLLEDPSCYLWSLVLVSQGSLPSRLAFYISPLANELSLQRELYLQIRHTHFSILRSHISPSRFEEEVYALRSLGRSDPFLFEDYFTCLEEGLSSIDLKEGRFISFFFPLSVYG